jgi:acyl transferase domain-containing protein/2-polyprenyl-3-methyl-5-hydroxy-6-metoxy-1,4-benzoquinol methylase/aryl carrier-like protein
VISGRSEAINALVTKLSASGIKTKKLNVSHAFHSLLMEPMLAEFEQIARQVRFSSPQIQLLSNTTGELVTDEITKPEYWCRHIRQPVKFAENMKTLEQQRVEILVEIGSKPILLGMGRLCLPEHQGLWLASLHPDRDDWQQLLTSLAQLYVRGVPLNWVGFDQDYSRRKEQLPTYPFQRQHYWIEATHNGNGFKGSFQNNGIRSNNLHPLLGQQLFLAGTQEIRFESQISQNSPGWVKDHRVFETAIFPRTGYLEIALAAGSVIAKSDNLWLEDVVIQQAMPLLENEVKTVQVIFTPQESDIYSFKIYSLASSADENNGTPSWTPHASGKLLVKEKEPIVEVDLAAMRAQCTQEIPVEELYQWYQEQGIDYGPSFLGLEQVWRHSQGTLGKVNLVEELVPEAGKYQLHPVLLDTCLAILEEIPSDEGQRNTYVPVGLDRLRVLGRPGNSVWCHAQLRKVEGQHQQSLSADFRLFTPQGELIAALEGLQVMHARGREAMLSISQESWKNWLYEVEWRPQVSYGFPPDYMPSPEEVCLRLWPRLVQLMTQPSLAVYGEALTQLEALSVAYLVAAFGQMGWEFQPKERFSTAQIAERLGVVSQHQQLFRRLLEILVEVGILQRIDEHWEVVSLPEIQNPQKAIASLSCPEAEAEITLLGRCGSRLAEVLQGKCNPLQILFPEGDTTTRTKLYQDSANSRVTNTLVQETVLSVLERLPQGRGLRILEIGAGTGATTSYLLPHLEADRTEYVFTDIGAFFVAKAQERFKNYPFVRYEVLDIEKAPIEQGFSPNHYDFIVVANVFETTSDLRAFLHHVKQLLAPGGILVLVKYTAPARWLDLTFGLTEGWWKFSDRSLRPDYLLISVSQWQTLLQEVGFKQAASVSLNDVALPDRIRDLLQTAVIVAQAEALPQSAIPKNWLLMADSQGVGQQLGELLRSQGEVCTLVFPGKEYEQIAPFEFRINPASPEHFSQLLAAVPDLYSVVNCWSLDAASVPTAADLEVTSLKGCGSTLHLVQALLEKLSQPPRLWLVTKGAQAVNSHHLPGLAQSPIWGMGKAIAQEHPELNCRLIDLDPEATGDEASTLFEEICSEDAEDQVVFRSQTRYVARLVRHRPTQSGVGQTLVGDLASSSVSFRGDSSYLITGGLGDLGLAVARFLVERGARHLVLLDRSQPSDEVNSQLKELELLGATVLVVSADVSDYEQLARVLALIEHSAKPLRGIIHSAGILDDGILQQLSWQRFERVMAPQVQGAWNLHALTQNLSIDFFVLFSSTAALLGSAGQANYCAANDFLNALAFYRRAQGLPGMSINWGAWGEIGMAARGQLLDRLKLKGEESMAPQQALQALEHLLWDSPVQVGVSSINWSRYLSEQSANGLFLTDFRVETQGVRPLSLPQTKQESKGNSLRDTLVSAPPAERQQLLESGITGQVAKILGFSATRLDIAESLTSLGLDSLMAIELRSWLNKETGVNLPIMKIMEGPSISQLAELILEELALAAIMLDAPSSSELALDMEEITL